ncbi:ABC transporter permease [Microbacterium fluvii]|uniref:ABC transporter permease n=1 Tax=Microbacterium fluvii TaxID=415215 RepID=A0ABW2HFG7_9MICO|nr:polyketide antibiotic transporter [Microbacterium fluvii]MCU4672948.1 polyketide antibiotic transporter [Microbacterium fluvii]
MSGFGALLAQRLRRDRMQVPLWAVGTALLAYLSYVGVAQSYGTEADREALLSTVMANRVILLFRGLPSGADDGAFMLFLILPFLVMMAAFMSTFLAVRHTRADEESGRAELVGATAAGRLTPLAATAAHGLIAGAILAALTTLAYLAVGLPVTGSLIAGCATGAAGLTFLGVGLVMGQLFRTPRAANAASVWIVLLTYLIAGIGSALGTPTSDLQRLESSWLVWLSPFGWAEQSRPFADDAGWPVVLCALVGLALVGLAFALQSVRDLGSSFVAERSGRPAARPALASPMALVWRLNTGALIGWAIGGLLTGMLATSLSAPLQETAASLPSVEAILTALSAGGSLEEGAVVIFFTMLGILAACCAVQVICRARQEETHGTAEIVLAAPVDRARWLADYVVVAFAGIVIVVASAVVGALLGIASLDDPDWSLMTDVLVTGGGQVAAASVFLVITALVFVLAPRLTIPLGWTLVMVGMILGLFGPLFGFPDWLVNLAPIGVAPTMTSDGVDLKGLWWLLLAVAVGATATLSLMRRRELAADG